MKKVLSLVAVVAIALFAVSCSSGNGPGAVVEKAYNAMISGDYKAFVEATNTPAEQQEMAVQMLEKTMKTIKEGADEEQKGKLPKSVKVLNEDVQENNATVEVEVTAENGETSNAKITLEKDKDGAWKITNSNDMTPQSNTDLSADDETEEEEVAEETEEPAEEEAEEAEEPAEETAE